MRIRRAISIENQGELTARTRSLVIDIGMYFATVLAGSLPRLVWFQNLTAKRNYDYGAPVLAGFPARVRADPVHLVHALAWGIARWGQHSNRLRELFDRWRGLGTPDDGAGDGDGRGGGRR